MTEDSREDKVPDFPRRPQFGTRFLKDKKNVFEHNAWDNVVWDESQEAAARTKVQENSLVTLTTEEIETLELEAAGHWNKFYGIHQNRFFKDRNWLFTEFPELAPHLAHTFPQKQIPDDAQLLTVHLDQCDEELDSKQQQNKADGSGESSFTIADSGELENKEEIKEVNQSGKTPSVVSSRNIKDLETDCVTLENSESHVKVSNTQECQSRTTKSESYPGESSTFRVLEVGCGVGNTVFPILSVNNDKGLFVYCCDFSSTAIGLVKESPDYDESRCHAFVCDVTSEEWGAPFPKSSLDVILCIFVLSGVHPNKLQDVVNQMSEFLRPGGRILFRDYGRYDLAQLRFKKGRCLAENFYSRGDGTRCYFFTQEEVREMMTSAGLAEEQNLVDRRLQVNRGKQLAMYRVWVQSKYRKPTQDQTQTCEPPNQNLNTAQHNPESHATIS